MTTKLDTFTFPEGVSVEIGTEAQLADKGVLFAGTTKDFGGVNALLIILSGVFMQAARFTDRDTLLALLTAGAKVDFYADDINYGSSGAPKEVWLKGCRFIHKSPTSVTYEIVLEEET